MVSNDPDFKRAIKAEGKFFDVVADLRTIEGRVPI